MPEVLTAGQRLGTPQDKRPPKVHFLTGACVTLWVSNPDHPSLAMGLIGSEGVVGLGAALGQNTQHLYFEVQKTGQAWCADSLELQHLLQSQSSLLWPVARYLWQMTNDIAQMAASIQCDGIPTRLAAWLVLCAQRMQSQQLHLTHDQLAQMMGVRRVSITLAAVALKELGLIDYKRGAINILDMSGLEQCARNGPPPAR
ncbi:MAG: Crp/Fnr family transcriptional regulator [Limnohabitans sp.]